MLFRYIRHEVSCGPVDRPQVRFESLGNTMAKSYAEINERIKKGEAVVVTAEEMIGVVAEKGAEKAARDVDVVTTGTFGAMCSSGAFLNFGHAKPRIKLGGGRCLLNGVEAYPGLAAVDVYIGATALKPDDPRNQVFPGEFRYGGGHVIEDLVARRRVRLQATAYGTDCYPNKEVDTWITIDDLNQAFLNDPYYRTIGIGTRLFLGGGEGYVVWHGTQHNPTVPRTDGGVPTGGSGTLAVIGDLKGMSSEWLRGASFLGYGSTLIVGLGVAIPILDADLARFTAVRDEDILAPVVDYSQSYPYGGGEAICRVSYAQLKSGTIEVNGKQVPTAPLSSYPRAARIAEILKERVQRGEFLLVEPIAALPGPESGLTSRPMKISTLEETTP
jgi:uncharacterized protein (DUF39 family)